MRNFHRSRLLVLAAVVAVLVGCGSGSGHQASDAQVFPGTGCSSVSAESGFQVGVTHTSHSVGTGTGPGTGTTPPPPAPAALSRAKQVLATVGPLQNMHIFGFGEGVAPEAPANGPFDFSALDARMNLICSTGGTPVITLCCSPSWATDHYNPAAPDDDAYIYQAPLPSHYQDYANLAVAIARRYPFVRYFQVWNEMKGFYGVPQPNGTTDYNQWDYQGYTAFYNTVYRALDTYRRSAHANVRIGGPYVPFPTWSDPGAAGHPATDPALRGQPWGTVDQRALDSLDYWLDHNAGADFLAVDAGTDTEPECPTGQPGCTDDQKYRRFATPAEGAAKFQALTGWLHRQLTDPARLNHRQLPIWWSEFYAPIDGTNASSEAAYSSVLDTMSGTGAAVALLWGPEYQPNTALSCHQASGHQECTDGFPALWTQPTVLGGGDPPPGPDYLSIVQRYAVGRTGGSRTPGP